MPTVFLALGSNLGDRDAMLRGALDAIAVQPQTQLTAESPIYETPPMGPQDQGPYLNMAAQIQTRLDPVSLCEALQQIELLLGRGATESRQRWGPREIDIDILLYGDQIIDRQDLSIPHPGLHERWFVLKPLADIAPDLMHPRLGRSIAELLQGVESIGPVETSQP